MKPTARHERRAETSRQRKLHKHSERVTLLSLVYTAGALAGRRGAPAMSRTAAKRRLRAEVLRLYGSHEAKLFGARLLSMKQFHRPVAVTEGT